MSCTRVSRHRNDRGAIAILTAVLIPVLILLTALAVDVGRWYVEAARVQKAADAAALGGVTWLPQDPTSAFSSARSIAGSNGYTSGVGGVTVTPIVGDRPSELYVTVSSTIRNTFGAIFGNPTTTISRTALADYTAPAIMGSPCNALGNQPNSTSGAAQPVGTVIPTVAEGGYATCQTPAGFWLNIAGPVTDKARGDRYATRTNCNSGNQAGGVFGCPGANSTNNEYKQDGYFFVIRVNKDAVGQAVTLQVYDPAFVQVADKCTAGPDPGNISFTVNQRSRSGSTVTLRLTANHGITVGSSITVSGVANGFNGTFTVTGVTSNTVSYTSGSGAVAATNSGGTVATPANMVNPYSVDATTAAARYAMNTDTSANAQTYCPGDATQNAGTYLNTSFVLRQQTDSYNPLKAPIQTGTNVGGTGLARDCAVQFGSQYSDPTAQELTQMTGNADYDPGLARVFHQWVDLCTFTPAREGDYYLQARTNVPLTGSTAIDSLSYLPSSGSAITDPTSIDNAGGGHNRFAIRASVPGLVTSGANAGDALGSQVAVSGWERMPIYANQKDVQSTFNLIQVLPNAAGSSVTFSAYDGGDGDCSGAGCTLQVLPPLDVGTSDGTTFAPGGCTGVLSDGSGITNQGTLANCKVSVAGDNGKLQTMTVQIPTNYTCDANSVGGCWYRVVVSYGGGVTDTTTWDATIGGDPVRLLR